MNSLSPASSTSSSTVLWCCSQRPEWMPRRMTACSRLLSSAVAKPHRELDLVSLIYRMEPKTKKWKTEKLKSKKRICSEVSINSPRGIRGHCPHSPSAPCCCSNRSISPAHRAHSSKPATAAGLLPWTRAGTDGQRGRRTDTVPFHKPYSAYYMCQ